MSDQDPRHADARDVEDLIAQRKAANPRRAPGREPAGAQRTRQLIGITVVVLLAVTAVLAMVLALGG